MCFISLAFRHNVELRCVQSTRQCCNTEGSVLPEVTMGGACEGCVPYRQERVSSRRRYGCSETGQSTFVCNAVRSLRMASRAPELRTRKSKKDDASERVAALRSAPHVRQLGRAERDLVGFGNAERPV